MTTFFEQDGNIYQVDIPFTVAAITFNSFCDFRSAEQAYLNEESPIEERLENYDKALRYLAPGDIDRLPTAAPGEELQDLIDEEYFIPVKPGHELTKDRIYAHIIKLIQEYKPDRIPRTFEFKHHGKKFRIRSEEAARVLASDPISTGETIEVLEYQRRAARQMEENPGESGNIEFNLGLTEFSILVKQPGERLPSGRRQRLHFLNQRKELFKDLDMATVLDVRYFFLNALLRYGRTRFTSPFGKALLVGVGQKTKHRWTSKQQQRRPGK